MQRSSGFGGGFGGGFSGFGATAPKKEPVKVSDPFLMRLYKIRDCYDQDSTSYRFRTVVYNTRGSSSSPKPAYVTQEDFDMACNSAPGENLEPHFLRGFKELNDRAKAQEEMAKKMREKLTDMKTRIEEIKSEFKDTVGAKLTQICEKNEEIKQKLMEICEDEEVQALKSVPFSNEEADLVKKLQALEDETERLDADLNTLRSTANFMKERMVTDPEIVLTEEAVAKIKSVLSMHTKAIQGMTQAVKAVERQKVDTDEFVNRFVG